MKQLIMIIFILAASNLFGQVKVDVKDKLDREANYRANSNTDKLIDKGFDKLEDGIGNLFKKKDKKKKEDKKKTADSEKDNNSDQSTDKNSDNQTTDKKKAKDSEESPVNIVWSKFDFIPGDKVIFEDSPSADEENGEFPSRWDLDEGICEIAEFAGEPVIMFPKRYSTIIPYLENSNEDYLPEVFTIEFDCYFKKEESSTHYDLLLYDCKNQSSAKNRKVIIDDNGMTNGNSTGYCKDENKKDIGEEGFWRHVSVAFTKGKLKVYLDNQRLINIPHYEGNPTGISISARGNYDTQMYMVKNIRIAKGGVKYYDRVLSDGKIIVNGIKFDVNKATLKQESMGPINKIYALMAKNTDINFSVEGHTDSDGNETTNQKLSEERAKTVMNKLIEMGINKSRLKSAGFGESMPLDNNSSPEGKANNRRVEFVKF